MESPKNNISPYISPYEMYKIPPQNTLRNRILNEYNDTENKIREFLSKAHTSEEVTIFSRIYIRNAKLGYELINLNKKHEEIEKIFVRLDFINLINYSDFDLVEMFDMLNFSRLFESGVSFHIQKHFVDNCINVEAESSRKMRLVHYVCLHESPLVLSYLIDKGINLESESDMYYRPIHIAAERHNIKMIYILFNMNVRMDARTIDGEFPIDLYTKSKIHNAFNNLYVPTSEIREKYCNIFPKLNLERRPDGGIGITYPFSICVDHMNKCILLGLKQKNNLN